MGSRGEGEYNRFDEEGNPIVKQKYKEGRLLNDKNKPMNGDVEFRYKNGKLNSEDFLQGWKERWAFYALF